MLPYLKAFVFLSLCLESTLRYIIIHIIKFVSRFELCVTVDYINTQPCVIIREII